MARETELRVELGRDCVAIQPGYNGNRHYDNWVRHSLPFGITVYAYEDGELIEVIVPADQRKLETMTVQSWLPSSFENLVRSKSDEDA